MRMSLHATMNQLRLRRVKTELEANRQKQEAIDSYLAHAGCDEMEELHLESQRMAMRQEQISLQDERERLQRALRRGHCGRRGAAIA